MSSPCRAVIRFFALFSFCFVSSSAQAWFCDHEYTAKGQIKVYDDFSDGDAASYQPLKGVKVRVYDGILHVGTDYTDSDGKFSYSFESCLTKLDLHIIIIPTSSSVNVAQFLIPDYWQIKPSKEFDQTSPGTHDFGTLYYGKSRSDAGKILQVFYGTKKILSWLESDHDIDLLDDPGIATGHVEVGFPSLTPAETSWYTPLTKEINLKEEDWPAADISTLVHEFTHLLQNAYGKWYLNIPDYGYGDDDGGWSSTSREYPEVANLEGFAVALEYFYLVQNGIQSAEDNYVEMPDAFSSLGVYGAYNHAGFYYDLLDSNRDQDELCRKDRCEIPLDEVLNVFASHGSLDAFSIAEEDMDDFIDRYYEIYGEPEGRCDFQELLYMNNLDEDSEDHCWDPKNALQNVSNQPLVWNP